MPAAMRKTMESPELYGAHDRESGETGSVSRYEQCREERIKENLQRMQSLGILDLSLKLRSETRPAKRPFGNSDSGRKSTRGCPPVQLSGPTRRSSRLQNVSPVSYSEAVEAKRGKSLEHVTVQLEEGARPEIYTEEHEKLLGNTERSWTFFVDGYGKDGKRIYDPVNGKTCHQCRQKTLGYRTQCSQCNMVQGQFCGDCLYMRYGEHVLETLENPDWICPVCRGICNCSLCRTHKGWLPTGAIYRRISKLGYKSVAHYLIQTKLSLTNSEEKPDDTPNQTSAKRSLSFQEVEALFQEHPHLKTADDDLPKIPKMQDLDNQNDDHHIDDRSLQEKGNNKMGNPNNDGHVDCEEDGDFFQEEENHSNKNLNSPRRSLSFIPSGDKQASENLSPEEAGKEQKESSRAYESCSERTCKRRKVSLEPNPDSIAGRLRQRRRSGSGIAIEDTA
ncbi:PREDICTED: uncharacterized protein LOC104819826 [Tarenaya hassleriana]|uniref:uncharacterized protein LOC104819826 n=1 Tax=Tarenaya hassleriana TaxID=28532 RepID=UPI00053C966B|nr:PREDICTED: uncharacterized protein LOC104819826 [Tarenaya hassleriana]